MLPEIKQAIASLFKFLPNFDLCVDLGCGRGEVGSVLKTKAKKVVGIDLEKENVNIAKANGYDAVIIANMLDYKVPKGALVTLFDAIEHVKKAEGMKLLKKVKNYSVILTTPSVFCPWAENKHVSLWTEKELKLLGFEVRIIHIGIYELFYGSVFLAVKPASMLKAPVSVIIPLAPTDTADHVKTTFTGATEIIEVQEGTVAQARNIGAGKAQSPYLLFVDCDMDLNSVDVALLPRYGYDVGIAFYKMSTLWDYMFSGAWQNFLASIFPAGTTIGGFIFCKKEVWEKVKFNEKMVWLEDLDFGCRAHLLGYGVGAFPITVTHTRPFTPSAEWFTKNIENVNV